MVREHDGLGPIGVEDGLQDLVGGREATRLRGDGAGTDGGEQLVQPGSGDSSDDCSARPRLPRLGTHLIGEVCDADAEGSARLDAPLHGRAGLLKYML